MSAREEALREFQQSRIGAVSCSPDAVFLQGWDARQAEIDRTAPKAYPSMPELRSSGWSGGPIV